MSAAAMMVDALPEADETNGAGIPGWVVLLDCERTKVEASERQPVEIVINDEGRLTIDRDVDLVATKVCHFVGAFSERGVLMFGAKFPPIAVGDILRLTPSGVFV